VSTPIRIGASFVERFGQHGPRQAIRARGAGSRRAVVSSPGRISSWVWTLPTPRRPRRSGSWS